VHVIATAGHVDHGKSTLVRALTGMEPDRWAEERRRGLTIDLGFAWLTLPSGDRLAFVDVPGHERFVPNMLAGVGPVPAVMLVVAADGGWMPQSAEHLAAIDALGITRGLLVVTRADLADPGPARQAAAERIAASSLGDVESVAVSAVTGQGLPELIAALDRLTAGLPVPDPAAPVRLWVDRAFSIKGSGTVVTGTLAAGTIRAGSELLLAPSLRPVRVRGVQSLKESTGQVSGVARVALNLRGVDASALARGMALIEPGQWALTSSADVRLGPAADGRRPPRQLTVHIGSARTMAQVRELGPLIARLTFTGPLPLHVGDRLLLRDPGAAGAAALAASGRPPGTFTRASWPALVGATVLDPAPAAFRGRGSAARAGRELAGWPGLPGAAELLRRHRLLRAGDLRAMGVSGRPEPVAGDWLADPAHWAALRARLAEVVAAHAAAEPLAPGMPVEAARAALGVPDRRLAEALVAAPLATRDGVIWPVSGAPAEAPAPVPGRPAAAEPGSRPPAAPGLPERVTSAVAALRKELAAEPFAAPDAGRLQELGLDTRALAAAQRAGLLLRITEQVVLAPGADAEAARILARLPQPFTAAEARKALGTTRRVAIPLLEYLDRAGATRRLPDDRRATTGRAPVSGR
jgi:selenocysteine-specific elongation factor